MIARATHSEADSPATPKPQCKRQTLSEAIDFLSALGGFAGAIPNLFQSDGNLWQQVGGGGTGGAFWTSFYWMSSLWFNRMQRYAARFCYMSNGYGATACNELTTLALGEGFKYTTKNQAQQKRLDAWLERNDWHERSIECFLNWLVDGEVFLRIAGEGESSNVSCIDPDLIYSTPSDKDDYFCGLVYGENSADRPTAFRVWDKAFGEPGGTDHTVPAAKIQHRANKHWGQKRGFSWMLPVLKDCFQADGLTGNLMGSAELVSKLAAIRQHQAPVQAAEFLHAQMQAQSAQWGPAIGQNGTPAMAPTEQIERYPAGAIIDSAETTEYKILDTVNYAQFGEVLDMALRKISAHFYLPFGVFSADKHSDGAYSAEISSGSWNERTIKRLQDKWRALDLKLMRMCGIDTADVEVTSPEIATPDKAAAVQEEDMLIRNKCRSRQTVCESHGGDWEQEKQRMLAEKRDLADLFDEPADELDAETRKTNQE